MFVCEERECVCDVGACVSECEGVRKPMAWSAPRTVNIAPTHSGKDPQIWGNLSDEGQSELVREIDELSR